MKKTFIYFFITLLIFLINIPAFSSSGLGIYSDMLFVPIGKKDTNDTRQFTFFYGINGFTELHENWRINYGISTSLLNGKYFLVPLSIAFTPIDDYKFHLRPQIFAGIEPLITFAEKNEFKINAHVGIGLDYIFDNTWYINFASKVYINDSFFKKEPKAGFYEFNTGVLALSAGVGYKF